MKIKTNLELPNDFDDKLEKMIDNIVEPKDQKFGADPRQALITEVRRLTNQAFRLGRTVTVG